MEFFLSLNPVTQALLATLFTWGVTAAGAALVFLRKTISPKLLDAMLGFAAGVMNVIRSSGSMKTSDRNSDTED